MRACAASRSAVTTSTCCCMFLRSSAAHSSSAFFRFIFSTFPACNSCALDRATFALLTRFSAALMTAPRSVESRAMVSRTSCICQACLAGPGKAPVMQPLCKMCSPWPLPPTPSVCHLQHLFAKLLLAVACEDHQHASALDALHCSWHDPLQESVHALLAQAAGLHPDAAFGCLTMCSDEPVSVAVPPAS